MSGPQLWPPRPCPLCGNPVSTSALVETHLEPTNRYPKADVVVWLCLACAVALTDATDVTEEFGPLEGGRR
jgi:hypothetical protein